MSHLQITEIIENKNKYMDLLFLADEQETMIDKYLQRGMMYGLFDNGIKAVCVVTDEGKGILEIKNIAVDPKSQRSGYGRRMIEFIKDRYKKNFCILQVGTGETPLTIPFYEKCGFKRSHSVKNFFVDNYDHDIYEDGIKLIDMIYLRMDLNCDQNHADRKD